MERGLKQQSGKHRREPAASPAGVAKIGDIVPQLIARYGLHQRRNVEALEAAWREAVGEKYAALTQVTGLFRGTLTVAVPHSGFVQELSFRQKELTAFLAAEVSGESIKKIRFVVQ